LRAANVDAIYYFLPGGMGVNFTKQYSASGMDPKIVRVFQGYDADQQMLTVGDLINGIVNTGQWSSDMDNEANKLFVSEFTKTYGRVPSTYASQAWDAAYLLDAAVRNVGGKIEDREAFIAAIKEAKGFKSVRGDFKFARNHFPIQNQYARVVTKMPDGKYLNKMVGPVLKDHSDAYIGECAMK